MHPAQQTLQLTTVRIHGLDAVSELRHFSATQLECGRQKPRVQRTKLSPSGHDRQLTCVWEQDATGSLGTTTVPSRSTRDSRDSVEAYLTMPLLTVVSLANRTACRQANQSADLVARRSWRQGGRVAAGQK